MKADDTKLHDVLLNQNYVDEKDLQDALAYAKAHHTTVVDYLLTHGLITKDLFGQALSELYDVSYADLNSNQPSRDQVLIIPEEVAHTYRTILFHVGKEEVTVTTDDPEKKGIMDALAPVFKDKKVTLTYSLSEDIDKQLLHYRKPLETRFSKILEKKKHIAPELLEEIFEDALSFRASDIHFEPQADVVVVRFRVDGVLREAGRIPKQHYDNILNRIKVESRLRIDKHTSAQDGAMRYHSEKQFIDLRTSIVPITEGEKIVLRLLSAYTQNLSLSTLGLSPMNQKILLEASQKPFGMILVTGPTGSGKTTTLYALLKTLNSPDVNITTIEDPVEYKMIGANQIQVNEEADLTFAHGLRSIVRQDPDGILVGVIRDTETAEISINAALTGHLLLSTFHANNAGTAIPRLLDMGAEPFLLASTLEVIIAQRLVRKICDSCRYSVDATHAELNKKLKHAEVYFPEKKTTLYVGRGCDSCGGSGFDGRVGIFEFIRATEELKELILKNPSTQETEALARTQGSTSLFEDGVEKVKNGITTLDELLRVASPPHIKN